jgi:acyl-CoA reductase-like NAD-dependent aldehyde dehydrogenase
MDWLLRHGEKYLRPETRSSPLLLGYKKSQVHYEPLGVVAAIVSWNYRKDFDLSSIGLSAHTYLSSLA